MSTDKGILFTVVLLAALLLFPAEVQSQAVSARASRGGAVGRISMNKAAAPLQFQSPAAVPIPAGTYTVGTAGYFPTLDSAFRRLSLEGILGAVTLLLTDTLYVAPSANNPFTLQGPVTGTGPASRITIRPADNVAVKIRGSGSATLTFLNVSYLTLDGIGLQGNTRLTVHSLFNDLLPWNDAIDFLGNCDFDVVRNLTARTDDTGRALTAAVTFWSDGQGGPDSSLISGLAVTSGPMGIFVGGQFPSYPIRPRGNVVRGNHIGSPTDSLLSRAIQIEGTDGAIIEDNRIENIRLSYPNNSGDRFVVGINAYFTRNSVIRNNIVHNVCATMPSTFVDGIFLTGDIATRGANAWVYNNMVYDICNRASVNVDMNGIGAWSQDSARVDFNTVYLSPAGSTSASLGSSALGFYSTAVLSTARNNILVNLREELSSVALAIWHSLDNAKLSDYNDLHVGQYDSSYVAIAGGIRYKNIAALHSGVKELHSVSVMPPFVGESDLHITNALTTIADRAIPVGGITADIDGNLRPHPGHTAPDIGADEFEHPPTGVDDILPIPSSFVLAQNFPNPFNPATTIRFGLPGSSSVTLSVHDLLGREVSLLANGWMDAGYHEVRFDGARLASGIYFYRLQAGDFIRTRKLLLLR